MRRSGGVKRPRRLGGRHAKDRVCQRSVRRRRRGGTTGQESSANAGWCRRGTRGGGNHRTVQMRHKPRRHLRCKRWQTSRATSQRRRRSGRDGRRTRRPSTWARTNRHSRGWPLECRRRPTWSQGRSRSARSCAGAHGASVSGGGAGGARERACRPALSRPFRGRERARGPPPLADGVAVLEQGGTWWTVEGRGGAWRGAEGRGGTWRTVHYKRGDAAPTRGTRRTSCRRWRRRQRRACPPWS